MKILIGIVAAFASATINKSTQLQSFEFSCDGTGKSIGNDGVREISKTKYRVLIESQNVSISGEMGGSCPEKATCTVTVNDRLVQVNSRNIPNADPLYSTIFQLDRKKLIFESSGGGLDGGWSIKGKCKLGRA